MNYYSDGSIKDWEEYEYDTNGNRTKFMHYNMNGNIYHWSEQECDVLGQVLSESQNGGYIFRYSYRYQYIGD